MFNHRRVFPWIGASVAASLLAVAGWAASVRNALDVEILLDPKKALVREAVGLLDEYRVSIDQSLKNLSERFVQQGDVISPLGNPPSYPTGTLKLNAPGDAPWQIGDQARSEVAVNVTLNERTTHRFAIHVMSVTRHSAKGRLGSGWNMYIGQMGQNLANRYASVVSLKEPGRYDVLYILSARPLKGGKVVVLDVESCSFLVPQPR